MKRIMKCGVPFFTKLMTMLIIIQENPFVICVHGFRLRCRSTFLFDRNNQHNNELYQKAWETPCSEQVRDICNQTVTLSYMEMQPFTSSEKINKTIWPTGGLLQQIISVALAECCGSCINIKYKYVQNRTELISIDNKNNSDILLPIFSQGRYHQYNSTLPMMNIPVIQLSSAVFIIKSSISATLFTKEIVMAIIDIWPLLGVAILLAFAAGVAIWIIDTWWNKEHFPRRFVTGAFEGFWWAFISMTTVGYGDRVPKSVPGRLLSVIWILCGITICALLTAALTTAIATVAAKQIPTINKGKIGLLKDRVFEKSILMKGNADKIYRKNVSQLANDVETGAIEGILLDIYTAKFYSNQLNKDQLEEDLFVDSFISDFDQSYLGLTIYDSQLYELIAEYFEFQKDHISDFIFDTFRSMEEIDRPVIAANLIFTTKSGMFNEILYTCLVIFGLSMLIGGIYELYQYKKQKGLRRERTLNNFTLKSLKNEETMLQNELVSTLKRWDKHLLSLMNAYSIEGMFKKSSTTFPNIIIKLSPYKLEKDYTADDVNIEEQAEEETSVTPTLKTKRKLPRIKRSKIEPLHQQNDEEKLNGYVKLKDPEDGKRNYSKVAKVKKTPKATKKKTNKTKATKKRLDTKNDNAYGTYQDQSIFLPNTARLPPLDKVEGLV